MSEHKIVVNQQFEQPVEEVYALLSDHNKLSKVFLIPVRRIEDGEDSPNGVGSVRRLGLGPVAVEETVTAAEPNAFIEYRITRNGGPIQNHRGRLDFKSQDQGTQVQWTIQFEAPTAIIGGGIRAVLENGVRQGLKRVS
ncbi:MAG: SRPBCC family protein [Salinisphaeraceae bacterium]|nr:SRPBCC family protein [Salinisphaeraceae bacterium]